MIETIMPFKLRETVLKSP